MRFKKLLALLLLCVLSVSMLPFAVAAEDTLLSQDKHYTVEYEADISDAYTARAYQTETSLTDGAIASAASDDAAWLELYRGKQAMVTVDLGDVCAVSYVTVGQFQHMTSGIYASRRIEVAVSEDGENFGTVGVLDEPEAVLDAFRKRTERKITLDAVYKARFVRVSMTSDVYLYVDEVSVFGSTDATSAKTASPDAKHTDVGFAKPIDGINSILLMYTGGQYSKEQMLPCYAYVDKQYKLLGGTMFDSMLFLPSPSGEGDFTKKEGWEAWLLSAFGKSTGTNMQALDNSLTENRKALGLADDYKYPVFISVPYLAPSENVFGEINGSTVTPNSLESRRAIVEWYIDYIVENFASAGFANLELKGVYWHGEAVRYSASTDEEALMKAFNDYAHKKSMKTIWIPYYCATGFEKATELGFDAATMQSGYAFDRSAEALEEIGSAKPGCVADSAEMARKYGLGMEFESAIGHSDYAAKFETYIRTAVKEGLMENGIMMMYQGINDVEKMACQGSESVRALYDMLYKYVNGSFTAYPPVIAQGQTINIVNGEKTSGNLDITDEDTSKNALRVADYVCPEELDLSIEGSGFYYAKLEDCPNGTYTVTLSVTDGYYTSDPVDITVVVTGGPEASVAESTPAPETKADNGWVIWVIIGGAVIVVAVVVLIALKANKKKK